MNKAIEVFGFNDTEVRVVTLDGEPWFVAKDIAGVLELGNPSSSLALLDDDEKGLHSMETLGGQQDFNIISESGLYSLILKSRKPQAKQFKRWVTHEVLPAIRKTGGYNQQPALTDEQIVAQALQITTAKVAELEAKIETDAPKVDYYETFVAEETDTFTFRTAAHKLNVSEHWLREFLKKKKRIYATERKEWSQSQGRVVTRNEYHAYADFKKWFTKKAHHHVGRGYNGQVPTTLYVTPYGLERIQALLGSALAPVEEAF